MQLTTPYRSTCRLEVRLVLGFTLIELLVVIAVIMVLASLLLPTMSLARERGRQSVCTNNQRQLYGFHLNHVDTNDGYLVRAFSPTWLELLDQGGYLPMTHQALGGRFDTVLVCPTYAIADSPRTWLWGGGGASSLYSSYMYNTSIGVVASWSPTEEATYGAPRRFSRIPSPSRKGMLADGYRRNATQTWYAKGFLERQFDLGRHNDRTQYLCFDGHTELKAKSTLHVNRPGHNDFWMRMDTYN